MKVGNQFGRVFQEFHRFLGKFVVTNLANKVFQSFIDKFRVKYLLNLEFNVVIDDDWRWGRLFLSNEGVASCGFNKRYMENCMTFHGSGEVQLISVAAYFLGNLKSPQPFEVNSGCVGGEPKLISDFVCRGG